MNAFIVDLKNKPGELATVAEAIAKKGINLTGFSGATCGDSGSVTLVAADESGARRALTEIGKTYREVELVTIAIADQPGTLATAVRRLASAGVNVEAALPTGMSGGNVHVGFVTSDAAKAKDALRQWILEPAHSR